MVASKLDQARKHAHKDSIGVCSLVRLLKGRLIAVLNARVFRVFNLLQPPLYANLDPEQHHKVSDQSYRASPSYLNHAQ